VRFAIITNDRSFVSERLAALGGEVNTIEHTFTRAVPNDTAFYQAHFKLDLLRAFGRGTYGSRATLVDIDMIMLCPIIMGTLPDHDLIVYDIRDQFSPGLDRKIIAHDIGLVGGPAVDGACWYGGEFLSGKANAFKELSDVVDQFWPAYIAHYRCLHHMGDEMIVTAALGKLSAEGMRFLDAGAAGLVVRWWTARTGFVQKTLGSVAGTSLFHLPADKPFLAKQSKNPFDPERFLSEYRKYAARRLWVRRLANPAVNLLRGRKYVGRL
jgi:hypothetical protein